MVEQVIDNSEVTFCSTDSSIFRQVFPSYSTAQRPLAKNSALARIREKRAQMKELVSVPDGGSGSA
jgi:hypothetical protein